MANILYNGGDITDGSRTNGILTFSEVPNILEVKEPVYGIKGEIRLIVQSTWSNKTTDNNQYYFSLFDETIVNTLSPTDANNKRFYIFPWEQGNAAANTAMSMVKAFRNCSSLSAEFDVTTATTNENGDTVVIMAKTIGKRNFAQNLSRNIPATCLAVIIMDEGSSDSSSSSLAYNDRFFKSKIDVEIYKNDEYVTTLEKNWYGDSCSFNMTPVLATFTEPMIENEPVERYNLKISRLAENGAYTTLGQVSGLTTYGYIANQSEKYKQLNVTILSNQMRNDKANVNYVYDSKIPLSVLARVGNSGGFSIHAVVYDSAMSVIYDTNITHNTPYGDPYVYDTWFEIPVSVYTNAYYVDLSIGSETPIRFNVIKPLNAADGCQRVLWRNEFGGLSFFDFTSQRSYSDSIEIETYEKNIFDYYNTNSNNEEVFEKKKIYSSNIEKTIKMKSHLMENNGRYIFDSMIKSKKIWTVINGKTYLLIPKSLEVTEDATYDNIWTATVQFEFSDII